MEVVAGPATAFDATLSGLLDLQDDLADTVIWLAENWSSDLPVPHPYARDVKRSDGERVAGVRLLVYCDTAGQLVGLAELLAVPVVVDEASNRRGLRYQRATRGFGRVEIEAYAEWSEPAS